MFIFNKTGIKQTGRTMKDMPKKPLEQMALVDSCGVEEGERGKIGALQANGPVDTKDNLRQFIDSVHQKASQVVQWLGWLMRVPMRGRRSCPAAVYECLLEFISLYNFKWEDMIGWHLVLASVKPALRSTKCCCLRFCSDMKHVLSSFESAFLALAEVQLRLDNNDGPMDKFPGFQITWLTFYKIILNLIDPANNTTLVHPMPPWGSLRTSMSQRPLLVIRSLAPFWDSSNFYFAKKTNEL